VGWTVEGQMTEELVIKRACGEQAGMIVHTDCGSQCVSANFRALLAGSGCRQSMSRPANCFDNAVAESFSYIEGYYNWARRHSDLGHKSRRSSGGNGN
jgi:transposase InsO family protein